MSSRTPRLQTTRLQRVNKKEGLTKRGNYTYPRKYNVPFHPPIFGRGMAGTMIPDFREDGYLPVGIHIATEAEAMFRLGASTPRRRRLVLRLRRWLEFFGRTRESDGRRKGLVEIGL
jgi:hypothetical protein